VTKKIPSEINNLKSEIGNPQTLRVLMVEDSENDALLLIRRLKEGGYNPVYERVETAAAMKKAVQEKQWDIILCDYKMPAFSAPSAIAALKKLNIDIPIIIVSGAIGEETAIECMHFGAHDYIMKSNLSRLCPAIARALEEEKLRKEQKKTEEKLHQEEQRFRALAEQSSDIIALVDPEGIALYENPAVEKYLGFKPEERIGKNIFENVHPDDLKDVTDTFNELFKDENVTINQKKEVRLRHKDGSWRMFEVAGSNLVNNKVIKAIIVNLRDITQRKQAESQRENALEALRQSEEKYRNILENIEDAYYEVDLAGNLTFFNDSLCRLYGYSKEELMGMNYRRYGDKETAKKVFQAYNKVYNTKKPTKEFDWQAIRKDGTKIYVEVSISLQKNSSGNSIGFKGIIRDVTDRKRSEEKLRKSERRYKLIAEKINDIVWIADMHLRMLYITPSVSAVLGYIREELPKPILEQMTPESSAMVRETLARELAVEKRGDGDPNRTVNIVLEYYHKDGSTRWLETIISGLRNDEGVLTGIHGVSRDITQRKQAEDALKESERKYRLITEKMTDIVWVTDMALRVIYVAPSVHTVLGFTQEEIKNQTLEEKVTPASLSFGLDTMARELAIEEQGDEDPNRTVNLVLEYYHKDGSICWMETIISGIRNEQGVLTGLHGVSRDITQRKQAEDALSSSETELRTLINAMTDVMFVCNSEGRYLKIPETNPSLLYKPPNELLGKTLHDVFPKDQADFFLSKIRQALNTQKSINFEYSLPIGNMEIWFNATISPMSDDMTLIVARDITDRKQAEEELHRLNRELRAISNCNQVLVRAQNEQTLLNDICRIICDEAGYRLAWVGYVEYDDEKTVRPVAWSGFDDGYVANAKLSWADDAERAQGPGGAAIRSGKTVYIQDFMTYPRMAPWRESALQRGYRSTIALPLKDENANVFGVLLIYSMEINAFTPYEIRILEELAEDLAFGITALRTRAKRDQTEVELCESEERYRLIAENTADTIAVFDLNLNPTYISPSILKLCGYTVQEAMTQTLNQRLTPDSLQQASKNFADQMALESSGTADPARTVLMELEGYCKDGSTIWVELAASVLRDNNFKQTGILTVIRNITQRKQAEDALRQKTALLEAQLNSSIEGILVVDSQGKKVLQNQRAIDLWKIPQHIADNEDDQIQVQHVMYMTVNPERFVEKVTYLYNHPDETTRDEVELTDGTVLERYSAPVLGKDGQNYGRIWAFRDITESKKAEENLRQSEEKYRNIIQSIEDGYAELDLKGNFLFVNNALCKIDGYPKNELMKLNYRDIMDEENAKKIYAAYHKVFITGESEKNFEYEIITKNGIRKYLETSVQPINDADNRVIAFRGIVRDRTERRLAEEKFRKIFMTTPDCIAITRLKDGLITDVNKGFEDIVGWKREEAIGTKSTEPPLNFWVDLSEREFMTAELKARRDVLHRQFEFRRRDGSVRAGIYSARPINIAGEASIIFIMQDITEQKRMESELVESQKMKLMSQIVSGVAHEVRNPLHAIQAISEAMAIDLKEDIEYKDYLMHIKAQVERLSHLMNDLLELGKPIQPSQFSKALLSEIASAALKSWMEAHPQLSQKVKVVNNLRSDDIVLVDTNKIQQVIINLMENAAQHSPQGEEILFTLGKVSKNCFMVEIIDKGVGLKPQDKPKVFEPFYTTRKSGTGLGLSLCKHIIESHGGSIDIFNNKKASGCTAWFTLPVYNSKEHK